MIEGFLPVSPSNSLSTFLLMVAAMMAGHAAHGESIVRDDLLKSSTPAEFTASVRGCTLRDAPDGPPVWPRGDEIFVGIQGTRLLVVNAGTGGVERELEVGWHVWDVRPQGDWVVGFVAAERQRVMQGRMFCADARTGEIRWERDSPLFPSIVRFSADGSRLLLGSWRSRERKLHLEILDPDSGGTLAESLSDYHPKESGVGEAALIDDWHVVFGTGDDHQPAILDVRTGEDMTAKWWPERDGNNKVSGHEREVSRDGRYLVSVSTDGWGHSTEFALYDLKADGAPRLVTSRSRDEISGGILDFDFSADGKSLAVACGKAVEILQLPTGELIDVIPGGGNKTAIAPDGARVAIFCGEQLDVQPVDRVWKKAVANYSLDYWWPRRFAIDHTGTLLAGVNPDEIVVWKIGQEKPWVRIGRPGDHPLQVVTFSPSTGELFASDSVSVWRWNLEDPGTLRTRSYAHWSDGPYNPFIPSFSDDGSQMGVVRFGNAWLMEVPAPDGGEPKVFKKLALEGRSAECYLEQSAFSDDLKLFAFVDGRRIQFYRTDPESFVKDLNRGGMSAWSRDLSWIVASAEFGDILIVDVESGKEKVRIPWEMEAARHRLGVQGTKAVSENGRLLAVGFHDSDAPNSGVAIFEVATGRLLRSIRTHRGMPFQITFTGDDSRLVVGNADKTIQVFDLAAPETAEKGL